MMSKKYLSFRRCEYEYATRVGLPCFQTNNGKDSCDWSTITVTTNNHASQEKESKNGYAYEPILHVYIATS